MASWLDEQDLFPYLQNNPELPTASTGGFTPEVAIEYLHGWPTSDDGSEAPQSLDIEHPHSVTAITAFPVYVPLDPQYTFPPYQTQPLRASEQTILDARDHRNRRSVRAKVKPSVKPKCIPCKREFERTQELNRHRKDVHEPQRRCPFCVVQWSRPDKIKRHITSRHWDRLTAREMGDLKASRGKEIVAFLDWYEFGLEVGTMPPNTASLDISFVPALM